MKQIEWINYFNNELTIESLNNNLDNFLKDKNTKDNDIKSNLILTKKKNNICKNSNFKNTKNTYIIEEEIVSFQNNIITKEIKTNKEIFRNKFKKNIVNLIKAENGDIKPKYKEEEEKSIHDNLDKKGKKPRYLNKRNCNNKKKYGTNKINYFKTNRHEILSYAKIHKYRKKFKKENCYSSSNKGKTSYVNNNILIERTLPEMYVLNNFGLLNDDDYEFYKKIIGSSPVKNKRIIKSKR